MSRNCPSLLAQVDFRKKILLKRLLRTSPKSAVTGSGRTATYFPSTYVPFALFFRSLRRDSRQYRSVAPRLRFRNRPDQHSVRPRPPSSPRRAATAPRRKKPPSSCLMLSCHIEFDVSLRKVKPGRKCRRRVRGCFLSAATAQASSVLVLIMCMTKSSMTLVYPFALPCHAGKE